MLHLPCSALLLGRFIGGLGIGVNAIAVPVYLAEIAPAAGRGAVVQLYELLLTFGTLFAVLIDFALQRAGTVGRPEGSRCQNLPATR